MRELACAAAVIGARLQQQHAAAACKQAGAWQHGRVLCGTNCMAVGMAVMAAVSPRQRE